MSSPSLKVGLLIRRGVKVESYLSSDGSVYVRVRRVRGSGGELRTRLCKAIPYLGNYCERCAHPLAPGTFCTAHDPQREYLDKTLAVGLYLTNDVLLELTLKGLSVPNELTNLIRALKISKEAALKLGVSMALVVKGRLFGIGVEDIDYITYVPKLESELKVDIDTNKRYNQAELLAKVISKVLNIEVIDAVVKTKPVSLLGLNISDRYDLAMSSYEVNRGVIRELEEARILLVDDVRTSGATGNAIARKLKEAGAKRVYLLVAGRATFKSQLLKFIDYYLSTHQ